MRRIAPQRLADAEAWTKSLDGERFTTRDLLNSGIVNNMRFANEIIAHMLDRGVGLVKLGRTGTQMYYAMRDVPASITWDDVWEMMR